MTSVRDAYPHAVAAERWDVRSATRVVSGVGTVAQLGHLVADEGVTRVLLVTDRGLAEAGVVDQVADVIRRAGPAVAVHAEVPANPSTSSLDDATRVARRCDADAIVALGGGSVLDAAKAVALLVRTGITAEELSADPEPDGAVLPLAAVPTTAGTGAETNGFGVIESSEHRKIYLGSERTVPRLVVLDPELTVGLPARVTAATGFDAVVHGAESLLSRGATAISRALATESVRLTTGSVARAVADGGDLEARSRMMTGAHLAGRALTLSGLGLVHGIGHSITATTGTPHGAALASVAGPALRFGIDADRAAYAELSRALGFGGEAADGPERAVRTITDLAMQVGLPGVPAAAGVTEEMLDTIVAKTLDDPVTTNAPRIPSRTELVALLAAP